jgi:aminopeptidase YwaD
MKRYNLRILCLLLAVSASTFAQSAQVAKTDAVEQNLRKHIEYLASDKLEGRRTGEPGAAMASKYISDQFAAIKLKPAFSGKGKASFLQPFPYVTGVEVANTGNEFHLEITDASGKRTNPESLMVRPVGFSPSGSLENVPVVFAGFGIGSKELNFDDYANRDVQGKVVLIFDGTPDNDNPHSSFGRFDVRTKALIAKDKGAVGVLLISREDKFDNDRLTRLSYDQSLGEAALPTFIISRGAAESILGVKTEGLNMIEKLSAAKKDPTAEVHINFRDTHPVVSFKMNLVKKQADAFNVIGILPGSDAQLRNEAIVIGSHYDHLGHGGQGSLAANSTEIHHGADDNASGVAAIIELARLYAGERQNKRTLIFIAFSGEEEGLLGSNYYVNNPVFPLDKTIAMINLDMVGRLKDDKLTIGGIGTASEWKQLVEAKNPRVAKQINLDGNVGMSFTPTFILQLNDDGFGPSDHSSFYGKKIPVLFFFTGTHNDYHKPSDTADKINYKGLDNVIYYVDEIAWTIDKLSKRPTYIVAKSSGTGGRATFNISLGTIPNYADATDGLLLDGVRDNSPAAKAGVKAGDKVVRLAGKEVRNVMDYTYILGEMKAGEEYEIVVLRGGEPLTLKIVPVKR